MESKMHGWMKISLRHVNWAEILVEGEKDGDDWFVTDIFKEDGRPLGERTKKEIFKWYEDQLWETVFL